MAERLIIQNFAGLNIDIELGRINIFIGPQASGKSVCAKCLYWFKSFLPDLLNSASIGEEKKTFDNAFISRFKKYFPGIWPSDEPGFLRYELNDVFIQLENKNDILRLSYSSILQNTVAVLRAEARDFKYSLSKKMPNSSAEKRQQRIQLMLWEPKQAEVIREELAEVVDDMAEVNQLFILAGRAFLASLKGTALTFLANNPITDPLLRDFLAKYEQARQLGTIRHPETNTDWQLANHILKGQLAIDGEDEYILGNNGKRVSLLHASSGQQEAFSLLLLLLHLLQEDSEFSPGSPFTVYIEEPEAHLFSESQRIIAQLMASIYHHSVFTLQYVITTHSPYFLACFNNLIYAHQLDETFQNHLESDEKLYQKEAHKKLHQLVPQNQQLPLADFRVYGLENGQARSLIDYETGLLSADLLDKASDVISEQFGDLMDLDPSTKP